MSSTVTYKCPNCGAGLIFDAEKQNFKCEFCLSSFAEEELLDKSAGDEEAAPKEESEFSDEISEYHCASCGAEIITDRNTAADICYYCHNPIVLAERVSGAFKPSKIVPFKFDKKEAKDVFLRYCKKKWFLPKDYFSAEQSDKISGVYYPFFVVDADAGARMSATAHRVRSWRSGNYRYTETSVFAVKRGGEIHFEDITASAISEEDKAMLESILPYPLDEHVDFSMPYLQGYTAKKRNLSREDLKAEITARMRDYSETLLSDTVNGYSSIVSRSTESTTRAEHWEYTLMPIWILTYKRKGKNYTYAMNGSTGKIYGELPVSIPKLSLFAGAIAIVTWLLTFLIGGGLL